MKAKKIFELDEMGEVNNEINPTAQSVLPNAGSGINLPKYPGIELPINGVNLNIDDYQMFRWNSYIPGKQW